MKKLFTLIIAALIFTSCKKEPQPTIVRFIDNTVKPNCYGTCTSAKFWINNEKKTYGKDYKCESGDIIDIYDNGDDYNYIFKTRPDGAVYRFDTIIQTPISSTLRLKLPDGTTKEINYDGIEDYHLRYIVE